MLEQQKSIVGVMIPSIALLGLLICVNLSVLTLEIVAKQS